MIAFDVVLGGGVQSAWGVEIQRILRSQQAGTIAGTPEIEQLFLLTAGTLNFLQPLVRVRGGGLFLRSRKVNIYIPSRMGMKPMSEQRRAVYSIYVITILTQYCNKCLPIGGKENTSDETPSLP